jgi:hypothetical protein
MSLLFGLLLGFGVGCLGFIVGFVFALAAYSGKFGR